MVPYKNHNYVNNNYRDNKNYNNRPERHNNSNSENNKNIDYSVILNYLKNPDDNKKYDLFSINGKIKQMFDKVLGGSQMRKFYNSIVDIHDKDATMEISKGRLAMILPIAYYANKRGVLRYELFKFINESIKTLNSIQNPDEFKKSLDAFKDVFQAVVAYTKDKKGGVYE